MAKGGYRQLEIETTFKDGDKIPIDYTGYGKNLSPEFRIKNLSDRPKSLVIILEDLSHPIKNFTHWIGNAGFMVLECFIFFP